MNGGSRRAFAGLLGLISLIGIASCGGGGGDSTIAGSGGGGGGGNGGGTGSIPWTAGVFQPYQQFEARCARPRTGTDPVTGRAFPDIQGSVLSENHWLRSWTNDLYLWYDEVSDRDPAASSTALAYFDLMRTTAKTTSGADRDKFHFTLDTAEWNALSQSGVTAGYGLQWLVLSPLPPRRIVVAFTEPGSPATAPAVNLARGAEVRAIDGTDIDTPTQAGVDVLNAGLFPSAPGQTHTFTVLDSGAAVTRTVTMQSANVTSAPVQNTKTITTATGTVGYMLFNDHLATAESALVAAVNTLQSAGITDLVLDIRYNGGGFLDIASELAYMIAGAGPTAGRTFEQIVFNGKHPSTDPVTGEALTPTPFLTTTQGFSVTRGQALPTLNLSRVFVLTGPDTCSASESVINGLRGVDVEVIQIGSTTCGKPYGFYPTDNCGTTYFSIQFRGVNAKQFGDYTDGFSPANTASG